MVEKSEHVFKQVIKKGQQIKKRCQKSNKTANKSNKLLNPVFKPRHQARNFQVMNDSNPESSESNEVPPATQLTDDSFDGIQQYDHPLPSWWTWLVFGCLAFAPPYIWFYHNGTEGRSLAEQHDQQLAKNLKLQFRLI